MWTPQFFTATYLRLAYVEGGYFAGDRIIFLIFHSWQKVYIIYDQLFPNDPNILPKFQWRHDFGDTVRKFSIPNDSTHGYADSHATAKACSEIQL